VGIPDRAAWYTTPLVRERKTQRSSYEKINPYCFCCQMILGLVSLDLLNSFSVMSPTNFTLLENIQKHASCSLAEKYYFVKAKQASKSYPSLDWK
jgi:hypothetical protein